MQQRKYNRASRTQKPTTGSTRQRRGCRRNAYRDKGSLEMKRIESGSQSAIPELQQLSRFSVRDRLNKFRVIAAELLFHRVAALGGKSIADESPL